MGNLKLNEIYLALIKSKNERKQIGVSQQIKVVTAWTLLVTYPLQPGLLLAEGIVGSTQGQHSPEVLESNSGVPTVNNNKPSNQGVSRNEYDDFNVGSKGAILNNSSEIIKSKLAGYIDGNNRLEGNSADIILNEVVGNNLSNLNGYIEVAGRSAETVIANPNGITCDGCGFINTPRSVLTTGTSIFDPQGDLLGYQVEKGSINFKGKGINAENLDQLDVLSRAVKINADIWANDLNIITGKNKIKHSDLKATHINSENDENGVSLDVAAIGGMYANRIKIIGTEKGFGVNSEGQLLARQNFKLTSEGDIHFGGATASLQGNVQLESKDILSNKGVVKGQNVSLKAHEIQNKTNESFVITEEVLDLNSEKLNNQGNFQADFLLSSSMDFKNSGLISADSTSLFSQSLSNSGDIFIRDLFVGSQYLSNDGKISAGQLKIDSYQIDNNNEIFAERIGFKSNDFFNSGKLISLNQININSDVVTNSGQVNASSMKIDFETGENLNSGSILAKNNINIKSEVGFDNAGEIESSYIVFGDGFLTNSGGIFANSIYIQNDGFSNNTSESIVLANDNLSAVTTNSFNNDGLIKSKNITAKSLDIQTGSDGNWFSVEGEIDVEAQSISNQGGFSGPLINLSANKIINNGVYLGDTLTVSADDLENKSGGFQAKNNFYLNLSKKLVNDSVLFGGDFYVETNSLINNGRIEGNDVDLQSKYFENTVVESIVTAKNNLSIQSESLDNFGVLQGNKVTVDSQLIDNESGSLIYSTNDVFIGSEYFNNSGVLQGNSVLISGKTLNNNLKSFVVANDGGLNIDAESLANSGNIQGKGVEFDIEKISNNKEGVLFAGEDGLLVNSDSLTNFGGVQGHKIIINSQSINNGSDALILANHADLSVQSDQMTNSGVMQGNSTSITASSFKNKGSYSLLASETNLDIQVANGDFENYGTVQSESLKMNAENLFNKSSGQFLVLSGQGEFVLQDKLINNGKIYSNDLLIDTNDFIQEGTNAWALAEDNFTLKNSNHINLATKLQAGGDFYLQAKSLTSNKKGKLLSGGYLDVNLINNLNNYGLVQGKSGSISANALTNQSSGQLATWGGRLTIDTTGSVTNKGTLTGHSLLLESRSLNNTSTLEANNHLEIDTDYQVTNSDVISGAYVEIAASRLDIQNADSALLAENQMHLNIQGNINNQGTLLGGRVYANAHDFNNTTANSLMAGLDYLQLDATGDIKNTQGAEIFSLGSLSLSADQLLNESSTIEAGQDLAVDVDQLTNRKRAFATEERTTTTEVDSHSIDPYGKYISGTRSYTETETTRVVTENSPSAYLLSGRNLSIQGDVDNLYSVISAGGSLSHNGGSLNNQSAVTNRVITRSGEDRMKYRKKKCITFSVFGYCALDITVSRYDNFDYNYTHTTTDTLASATFSANKNLTGRVDEVNNVSRDLTNVEDQNLLPAPNTRQAQGQADPVELNAPTTDATEGLAIKSGSDVSWMPSDWEQKEAGFELPSSPLITVSETPDHHYLVETSPHLTNYKEFISSDYMVQRLEHNPAKTTKRLGDGFVEQRLIRDQILEQTGVQYLGDFTSQEDQYRQLMENAIKEVGRLELTPGIALTDRQIEELQKPLVWMVEETFATENGPETALVPRVYLGHSDDIQLRPDGSLIAAQNVHLEVDGDFQNQGSLLASEDLGIRTRDLTNTGEIQTGGNLFLETEKDLTNRDGLIKGDQVGLAVGKNLINETQSTQLDYKNAEGELTGSQTFMAPTAEISGNNLAIEVGQDLTALGSRFDAAKNMSIQVDGQMELGTTQSLNQRLNRTLREVDATHQVTELNAGEQLQLSAGESLESQAAQIKAGTDMLIQAKDITLTAAKNVSENFSYMDKGTSGKITTEIMQETVLGNLIQAGGNLVASSLGGDLVSTASEFLAKKGTLALQAKNNIQLKAAQQKAKEYTQKQTKSSGFFNKTTRTRTTSTQSSTAIGNSLSGGRVEVSAGQDLEITASEVVSGHGTSLMAGGNLTLEAGENKVTTSSDYQKKRSGVFSNGGLSITAGKQKTDTTSTTTQTQAQQSVVGSLKGDVNLQAGKKYQQVGSQVTALEGDINVQAEDISITEFQETFESEQQTKFKQSGLTVSLSSPVIDAYESAKQTYEAGETAKSDRMKALAAGAGLLGLGNNASDTVQAGKATATGDVANMGLNLTATVGSTKSSSESQQSAITARGSQLSAGKNINLVATGGGESSNILIQGSQVKSGENTTLVADHSIDLLAAQNTSQQTSDSKSSSYGIGVAAKIDSGGFSAGLHLAANGSRGDADGQSVTHTNSQISAGEQLYLQSGGDTRLLGAVAQAEQIAADIGGDLTLQSLQDTQAYDSESQSLGGSVTIGLGGSGSAHYSQSDVQANYASVNQQSGLQAGDGGFQLQVDGNTTLNGGVISSSDTAVENRNNNLETTRIHTQDIQNRSRYSAESIGVSTGGAGYGHDSDTEKSTTPAGISGIAGHTDVRTGDQETGLKNNFDAQEVESDIQAQQQITAEFGKNASKAVGDFADQQAKALRDKLRELDDPEQQQALLEKAQKWDEGGLYRVTAHAVVGGLSGDLDGALGSSTAALAAPALNDLSQDLPEGVDKAVSTGIAVGLGMATGHIQGGVTALNEDLNNRQLHPTEEQWIQENAEAFAKQEDISVDEAKERLSQQALVNVDYLWRAQLREGEDMAAEDFLTSNENTFTNDLGYQQKLFTAEGQQLLRPEMYADTADVSFYQNYVQPGVTRELNAGLREELWNSTQAGLGATLDLTQALSENPEAALDGLTSSLLGLPQSMKDSFVETGHALGESTAVVLNPELSGKLNELYGTDVGVHQGTLAGLRTTGAVLGSLGAGKTADALGDAGKEAAESVSKRLDQLAEQTGNQALIRSGGQLDSQGNPLLDMRDLTTEQKGMMGELLGPETVRQIVPEGEKLARMPSVGETGIDDLFSVNRPDVDYVVIEYKFVGNNKTPGSQRLGNTADGRQGAESWTLGSGRLDQAVGRENALIIGDAIKSGRVESWVVTTRPNGSTEVEVLDAAGRVKPMDTSSILRNLSAPLNGAQP